MLDNTAELTIIAFKCRWLGHDETKVTDISHDDDYHSQQWRMTMYTTTSTQLADARVVEKFDYDI